MFYMSYLEWSFNVFAGVVYMCALGLDASPSISV